MAEDWDLGAVVRSCYRNPAATTTTRCVSPLEPDSSSPSLALKQTDKPFDFVNAFGTSTRRRNNGFDELYEVYATFLKNSSPRISVNPNSSTSSTSSFVSHLGGGLNDQPQEQAQPINPMSLVSFDGFKFNVNVNHPKPQEKLQAEHTQLTKSDITTTIAPPIISSSKPKPPLFSVFRGFCDGQGDEEGKKPRIINPKNVSYSVLGGGFSGDDLEEAEEEDKKQVIMPCSYFVGESSASTNQKTKLQPKKEKMNYECGKQLPPNDINKGDQYYCGGSLMVWSGKQQRRTIRVKVIDGEELVEVDDWNWRKYGRKAIKASPYPRNYYKCSISTSTSSGSEGNNKCKAKKYVEKCQSDPERFMVTYIGDHKHSPPRKRNSNININSLSSISCTTTTTTRRVRTKTSTTPTTTTAQKAAAATSPCSLIENGDDGVVKVKVEVIDEDEEDEDEDEDVFVGLQDLGARTTTTGTSANNNALDWSWRAMSADDFSFVKLLQSPWSPKSTTTLF